MAKKAQKKEEPKNQAAISLKSLTKSSVWDIQENDIFRMLTVALKDTEVRESLRHYTDIIRSAFMIEELKQDGKEIVAKYTKQGYQVGTLNLGDNVKVTWALKKRPITRVTDLTYENIRHISAAKLLEVIDRNFGGGWDSLSQSIQEIIESGFDITTTTQPNERLHKKGGMYEKKVADGFEVLEVSKGSWVEAIFAKLKPETFKPRMKFDNLSPLDGDGEDDDSDVEIEDTYNKPDEDDVEFDEPNDDEINENNYRTTVDIVDDEGDEDAESLSDYIADE